MVDDSSIVYRRTLIRLAVNLTLADLAMRANLVEVFTDREGIVSRVIAEVEKDPTPRGRDA
jgi:hypothetical protein